MIFYYTRTTAKKQKSKTRARRKIRSCSSLYTVVFQITVVKWIKTTIRYIESGAVLPLLLLLLLLVFPFLRVFMLHETTWCEATFFQATFCLSLSTAIVVLIHPLYFSRVFVLLDFLSVVAWPPTARHATPRQAEHNKTYIPQRLQEIEKEEAMLRDKMSAFNSKIKDKEIKEL